MTDRLTILGGIKVLSKYIKKHRLNFILFYTGWLLDSILTVITPIMFAIMIDEIVYNKNLEGFQRVSLVFVVMSIFSCVLYFFIYTQHHYLMSMYTYDIKLDIFKKMQLMDASYMSNAKTGDIISILLSDTGECMHFVTRNVIHLVNGILKGIFYITYIYIISVKAGLVVTLFLPFTVYSTFKFNKRIREHSDKQRDLYGGYLSWLFEILNSLTDIRLLCAEKIIQKKFTRHLRNLFNMNIKTAVSNLSSEKMVEFINLLMQLSIYGICAYLTFNSGFTIGSVMVLVSYVLTLKDEIILALVRSLIDAQSRLTSITRIKLFLNESDETSWAGRHELVVSTGNIEFNNIEFSYGGGDFIFKNLSVVIPAGSHTALVGRSGSGKSTLTALLIGMYKLKSGEITIDGQNITDCSLKSIRQNIGIVQQDTLLFTGTIRENLLLGNPKATDHELWEACKRAGIAEYFGSLPEKLDTSIQMNGAGLSGGQRQRLGIARIYLKNPAIIIFDEATSALDSETETIIHEAWQELLKEKTSIIIAHRLSSVMQCDNAMLIEDGIVKAKGHPDELFKNNESFRELFAVKEAFTNA